MCVCGGGGGGEGRLTLSPDFETSYLNKGVGWELCECYTNHKS